MKLFESEQKVMEVLWEEGEIPAKQVVEVLKERYGWNKNTTYTVIKKCIEKGAVLRSEPGFICRHLIDRHEFETYEVNELISRTFKGSKKNFISAFFEEQDLSKEDLEEIEELIHNKRR
ncbi:BlaI/MecI/CopY family transcriptional regulator [Blautia hominis]|uniref:BlaI/MecI/CopY family transcriptional regulator n=1 Tax=Blautia hominis TaxID=2025493 RepID=A0ABQ0B512_9FIRM